MVVRLTLLLFLSCLQISHAQVEYEWQDNRIRGVIFKDIDPNLTYTVMTKGARTNLAGSWSYDSLYTFRPAVPLSFDHSYLLLDPFKEVVLSFKTPDGPEADLPMLTSILPGVDTLPSNQLKMYLTFNQPMRESDVYDHLELWDLDAGEQVSEPFLALDPALWNTRGDTLTLWFDPGRIKRELIPNKTLGPVLTEGHRYRLIIKQTLMDSYGRSLQDVTQKDFFAGKADRVSPDPDLWTVHLPESNTKERLVITFNEPMDMSTVLSYIDIYQENERRVMREYTLNTKGTQLFINPLNTWNKGDYTILIQQKVEDLAGNRIDRLFDQDASVKPSIQDKNDVVIKFALD